MASGITMASTASTASMAMAVADFYYNNKGLTVICKIHRPI